MEKCSATVNILERSYKLSIPASDEKYLRDAAAFIDSQARIFKKQYGHRDNQDLLAMVALAQVTELFKTNDSLRFKDNDLIQKLSDIDSLLEQNLHPTQNSL
ncbi:MAG: cell division protein ZapA [Bacteroidales bacterium]|nr:cell division protein ZapA [Bacteroidales bacterium]